MTFTIKRLSQINRLEENVNDINIYQRFVRLNDKIKK